MLNVYTEEKVDRSGLVRNFARLMKGVSELYDLKKPVEDLIGEVTIEEWDVATRDVVGNDLMHNKHQDDETLKQKLIASIDFFRRHNLGVKNDLCN